MGGGGSAGCTLEPEHAAGWWHWMRPGRCTLSYLAPLRKPLGVWGLRGETPQNQALTALAGSGNPEFLGSACLPAPTMLPSFYSQHNSQREPRKT